jgi:hypothetical protein
MKYSIYCDNTPPKMRIMVGFIIRCDTCIDKTRSALREKEDYLNDGNKIRFCTVCNKSFVSSPVFEVLSSQSNNVLFRPLR